MLYRASGELEMSIASLKIGATVILLLCALAAQATPCNGIDRRLDEAQKAEWNPAIEEQFSNEKLEILQMFRFGGWYIVYVSSRVSENSYLFFRGNPLHSKYVTQWGGAAGTSETDEMESWVRQNAPGIPRKLARCFAFHVTKDRDL